MPSDLSPLNIPRIGMLDSGIGGLSIYEKLKKQLPGAQYFYCADNRNYPYGTKPAQEVAEAVKNAAIRLTKVYDTHLFIIACNTATVSALSLVRENLAIPVIGVVPAIKPAAAITKTGVIGLLATPGTIYRTYTDDLVRQFAPRHEIIRVGSKELVDLAEAKLRGETIDDAVIEKTIAPFFKASVDVIVLACTHFPLLKPDLERLAPRPVTWIDSGDAIVARTRYLLGEGPTDWLPRALENDAPGAPKSMFIFTKDDPSTELLTPALTKYDLQIAAPLF